ncbi:MAG TPA: MmcQ/YjbR family DNA-binding protein [Rhizomicrobium sp.]|nr:MmcQ/YjbR family DNA-binding protein [Rhizomicrobium sp.]
MKAATKKSKPAVRKTGAKARSVSPFARLRKFALGFPETHEDHPWGDTLIKVRGKTFVFMGESDGGFGLSVKLPQSKEFALEYPFTKPTPYGLGKSGWVSAQFTKKDKPPLDVLEAWINESFRAIAPKSVLKTLAE